MVNYKKGESEMLIIKLIIVYVVIEAIREEIWLWRREREPLTWKEDPPEKKIKKEEIDKFALLKEVK